MLEQIEILEGSSSFYIERPHSIDATKKDSSVYAIKDDSLLSSTKYGSSAHRTKFRINSFSEDIVVKGIDPTLSQDQYEKLENIQKQLSAYNKFDDLVDGQSICEAADRDLTL